MKRLVGINILMVVDDIYEDLELWYPKLRMIEEGAKVVVAGLEKGRKFTGKHGYPCTSDEQIDNIDHEKFDAFIIPGGFAPDKLRRYKTILDITKQMFDSGKLIAHICHAGWIPISAKIMNGFECTSTPGIKDDLENAGAIWIDKSVVIDRNMVSSRRPDDLPDFCEEIINYLVKEKKS